MFLEVCKNYITENKNEIYIQELQISFDKSHKKVSDKELFNAWPTWTLFQVF